MQEIGRVIKVDAIKDSVTVEFDRKSACDKCGICMISKDKMKVEITAKNTVGADTGDRVAVMMGDRYVLTSSFVVYMVPVMLITLAFFITRSFGEAVQIIAIGGALLIGVGIIVILDRILRRRKGYRPEIIEIIFKSKEEKDNDK